MNTRLIVNLASGVIEAEGDSEFVKSIYADLRETIIARSANLPAGSASPNFTPPDEADEAADTDGQKGKKGRRRGKASGPCCAALISGLKDEGYFSELRSAGDVGAKLREKGTAYEGKHVAASLIDLVRRGALRRVSEGGSWSYQNP